MTPDTTSLKAIRSFKQLVGYLRSELDWPIESDDFEELTFDYAAEELGLDKATAVKIKEIKQLRPLSNKQPWGIFFVNFEPKRLPVVALRRILSTLVLRKRQSANRAQQASWRLHDLLFISSYGEAEHRDITFAHFSEEKDTGDLPTLRVLGWDDEDTPLHIGHVEHELRTKLRWPKNENDVDAWRASWSSAFTLRHREVIKTSQQLAIQLADLARSIRRRANSVLRIESDKGPLRKLYAAFKEALIHDLSEDDFADMYAQTISYGLLTARVSRPAALVADNLTDMVPVTNPFLKELLETFLKVGGRKGKIDFDELGINDVVQLLRDADMEAVLRDFDDRNPQEDPAILFYELFLKEYDAKKRVERGVFYTPRPIVSFIVRTVHGVLQREFGLRDGLADTTTWGEMAERHKNLIIPAGILGSDPFVQILDPATGTGTFLVEAIEVIYNAMTERWRADGHLPLEFQALWNDYVPKHLLPRLFGFELMMAPYAIAHMKIGLKLASTGYRFRTTERAQVYLTNSLEPATEHVRQREFETMAPALAHEATAVNAVKARQRFTVVIGNPPYSNFGRLNRIPFILGLLEDYKRELNEKKLNLDDDYIKFIRFGHHLLTSAKTGVFGMITNNVFIDGITHRQMRATLLSAFSQIAVCDLHGSVKKLEKAPNGSKDENVFDIQQGVGITFLIKCPDDPTGRDATVHFTELWGSRSSKYEKLASAIANTGSMSRVVCIAPYYFFVPKVFAEEELWKQWLSVRDAMPTHATGVKTHLDEVFVGFSRQQVEASISTFLDATWQDIPLSSAKRASPLKKALLLKQALRGSSSMSVADYAYRALDMRKVAYIPTAIEAGDHRYPVMRHMLSSNIALATTRQLSQGDFSHVLVTRSIADMCLLSTATKECAYLFPLMLMPEGHLLPTASDNSNLSEVAREFVGQFGGTPTDFIQYAYAILHSGNYRTRYAELLKIDFPRLPLTDNPDLFRLLTQLGGELVSLHLLESQKLNQPLTKYAGAAHPSVEKPLYADGTVWVDRAQTCGFHGVSKDVWNFHIGGYQVCEKWLKDRKGRKLSTDDIVHYQKIVVALKETIRLMTEIDQVIDTHGGWPGAFQRAGGQKASAAKADVQ